MAAEREARRTAEVRAETLRQKMAEAEEARWTAEGTVVELRGSLSLVETAREVARSELCGAQQHITGMLPSSSFLLSSSPPGRGPSL